LPVTPLRRSEKKRPPSPPALVGKMAMGPIRWITRNGKRVKYRDWMTDPKTSTYPMLYMTGHRDFHWSPEEVARLQRYLKAGGFLLADACCGRMAFDMAFRREIAKVFPNHELARLPGDHPFYHCHYGIEQVDYTPRVREDFGPFDTPELEGIALDGRLAVVYSKFDLGKRLGAIPPPVQLRPEGRPGPADRHERDRLRRHALAAFAAPANWNGNRPTMRSLGRSRKSPSTWSAFEKWGMGSPPRPIPAKPPPTR
jgi:hypothetical protein